MQPVVNVPLHMKGDFADGVKFTVVKLFWYPGGL